MNACAKNKPAKPDRRSVGETELHYLWIQLFYSALNAKGRAEFVMANSASDARGEIKWKHAMHLMRLCPSGKTSRASAVVCQNQVHLWAIRSFGTEHAG